MCPPLAAFLLLLLQVASLANAAPTSPPTEPPALDCDNDDSGVYDQRQNGTENYRIHVNGVVVLVAPAEAVLQAAQLSNMGAELEGNNVTTQALKPRPKPPTVPEKVPTEVASATHPKEKNNLKLLNLLHMFRSIKHETEDAAGHPSD